MTRLRRRDWMLGTTLASSLPLLAQAQPGFEQPPELPPLPQLPPLTLHQARLPNGVHILVLPRPGAPRTSIRLITDAGWLRDPFGKEGLAEVALSMLAQGARRGGETMESADIAYASDLLGRPLQLDLSPGSAELALEAVPDQCDDAVNLLADLGGAPTLEFESLEHMRSRAQDALALRRADALMLAPWVARRMFWGRAQPVQTTGSLKRLKRDDVLAFHRQYWRPDRSQLLFCGDLTLEAARGLAADFLDDWKPPKSSPNPPTTAAAAMASAAPAAPLAYALTLPRALGCRLVVQTAIPRGTPRVLRTLARLLLEQRLAAQLPGAWTSEIEPLGGATCWRLSVTVPSATLHELLPLLREQLPKLSAEAVSPEDLAMAQALALGDWQMNLQRGPDELLSQAVTAGELEDLLQWPQRLRAVSAPVLQLLMSASWRENRTQLLLLGDPGKLDGLQRAWPGVAETTMRAVIGE
jgi:zinc protease